MNAEVRVVIGRVSGVHGVRGWVKIYSYTRPIESILDYTRWMLGDAVYTVAVGQVHGAGLIAQLDGVDDRDQAAALVGCDIAVLRSDLPPLAPGEVYWADLVGLDVVGIGDEPLGVVSGLMETGAHDVMVVRYQEREELIPYVRGPVIEEIDLEARRVKANWASEYWDR